MRFPRLAVTAVALALVGLTGCGQQSAATLTRVHDFTAYGGKAPASAKPSNGVDAADIWAKTLATFTSCKSVRIDGTVPSGTRTGTVNLAGACDGSNARAQTTTEGESFEVITISGTYYVKANTAFWLATGASNAQINAIGSRYLATTDPRMGDYTVAKLVDGLKASGLVAASTDLSVESTTQGGQAAYKLVRGARTSASSVTVWTTVKDAVPLRVKVEDPSGSLDITFSDWNAVSPFTAPPPAQVVKI
jgi:outer membrane lipoprotein-sorting protein